MVHVEICLSRPRSLCFIYACVCWTIRNTTQKKCFVLNVVCVGGGGGGDAVLSFGMGVECLNTRYFGEERSLPNVTILDRIGVVRLQLLTQVTLKPPCFSSVHDGRFPFSKFPQAGPT